MRSRFGLSWSEIGLVSSVVVMCTIILFPRFSEARHVASESELITILQELRTSIKAYKTSNEKFPGQGTIDPALVEKELSKSWKSELIPFLPVNPFNGKNTILVVRKDPRKADGSTGWVYNSRKGTIRANIAGANLKRLHFWNL